MTKELERVLNGESSRMVFLEGIYSDLEPVHFNPTLKDMCAKVEKLKRELSAEDYPLDRKSEVEQLLKSFILRTEKVSDLMSQKEKALAKQAYLTLDSIVRRYKMNSQLANALSQAGDKIAKSGD